MEKVSLDHLVRSWHDHSEPVDIGDGFEVRVYGDKWRLSYTRAVAMPSTWDSLAACILEADRIKQEEGWYLEKQTWPLEWECREDCHQNDFYKTESEVLGIGDGGSGTLYQVIVDDAIRWTLGKWPGTYWQTAEQAQADIQREHDDKMRAKLKGTQ